MQYVDWGLWQWLSLGGVSAGAAVVATWVFIKFFGGKMISHEFDKRLEAFKTEQNLKVEADRAVNAQALERMRFDIAASLDRTAKLHQFEFEVLPQVWRHAQSAISACNRITATFKFGTDIGSFSDREREELYAQREYTPAQRDHIEEALAAGRSQGQDALNNVEHAVGRKAAWKAYFDFHNYLLDHGIFIQPELRDLFSQVDGLVRAALHEEDDDRDGMLEGSKMTERREARRRLEREWPDRRGKIEQQVQARLWDARLPSVDQRGSSPLVPE